MMTSKVITSIGSALILGASIFVSAPLHAQTVTITGCASLTSVGGNGVNNIIITCNSPTKSDGGPVCSGLNVTPPDSSTNPSNITLTANCSAGLGSSITSYTFSGPGVSTSQAGPSLQVTAPTSNATYSVTATSGSQTSAAAYGSYTVGGGGGGGAVDLSACTAQGYTGRVMDLPYSVSGNIRLSSDKLGTFGNSDALVLRFTTPASTGDTSAVQFSQIAGTAQVFRVATVSTSPCSIAASTTPVAPIIASSYSKSPIFYFNVGTKTFGRITLAPNTTYYITVVNRNGYGGSISCTGGSCGVLMDFTT